MAFPMQYRKAVLTLPGRAGERAVRGKLGASGQVGTSCSSFAVAKSHPSKVAAYSVRGLWARSAEGL